jgi:Ca2+-binding EF-hand superfamily protein
MWRKCAFASQNATPDVILAAFRRKLGAGLGCSFEPRDPRDFFRRILCAGAFDGYSQQKPSENLVRNGEIPMKRAMFISGITVAAIAVTAVAALAATGHENREHMQFEEIDVDGNGQITAVELEAASASRFSSADSDGDGFLTQSELELAAQARAKRQVEAMMAKFDADKDGKIALVDIKSMRDTSRIFDRLDRDKDGSISKDEFDAANEKRMGHSSKAKE